MNRDLLFNILAAFGIGAGLWFVVDLDPVWWLAWILPGLLLALALRTAGWTSRGLIAVAALIGVSSNYTYFLKVMPLPAAMLVLLLQTALWMLVIGTARRIVKRYESAWTVLALPVISVAADTLLAHLTPDGNWGSLAYTQAGILPIAQLAAVFGVGGILFLLMLANSAIAVALTYGTKLPGALRMYGAVAGAIVLAAGLGWWRLQAPVAGTPVSFGIASLDDYVETSASEKSRDVWAQYEAQVLLLAGSGAKVVLLPEKIAVLAPEEAAARQAWLGRLARANHVWLVAGLGVDDGKQKRNEAWWFAPDGRLVTNYLKHHLAPPEREFASGVQYPVNDIDGVRYGVAICKDMHFANLGRAFGRRNTAVMLVPAWDFQADAWMAANMSKLRGVESGYSVVRSSREGLLSVSDAYGRMLAVDRSTRMPGTTLFARVAVGQHVSTIYTRIGDFPAWLCVAAAALLIPLSWRRRSPG